MDRTVNEDTLIIQVIILVFNPHRLSNNLLIAKTTSLKLEQVVRMYIIYKKNVNTMYSEPTSTFTV